jgi:hypothetical protein
MFLAARRAAFPTRKRTRIAADEYAARFAAEGDVQMRMQTTVTGTRKRASRDGLV